MKLITFFARRYVAGDTWRDAIKVIRKMNDKGISVLCDLLGENVMSERKVVKAKNRYVHLLDQIKYHKLDANVSVKLSQLGLDISEDFCRENVEEILRKVKGLGSFMWIDMESAAYTDRTLDLYEHFMKSCPDNVGVCVQSYLRRSEDDVRKLLKFHPSIRLVKGAYKESEQLAFKEKKDTDENFKKLAGVLMDAKPRTLAVATHDEKLVNFVLKKLRSGEWDAGLVEFEMLYGIRSDLQEKIAAEGFKVRVYTPFGANWFPYYLRRLRERKENLFFVLRNLFRR